MSGPRILMPSIVDPSLPSSGAASVARGLVDLLNAAPLSGDIQCLPLRILSPFAHKLRQAQSLIASQLSMRPSKHLFTRSPELLRRVRRSIQESHPDLCLISGSDLVWLLDILPPNLPVVLLAYNLEHRLYQGQLQGLRGMRGLLAPLLRRDRAWLERYEVDALQRISNIIFVSTDDYAVAKIYKPEMNALIFPPVFHYPPAPRPPESSGDGKLEVGFTGSLRWWPNREGVEWFLRTVFPHVKNRIRLHLFGVGTETLSSPPGVIGHGFESDPARVWGRCHLMISPVFRGGGVSTKLAEAIYNRATVLASPFSKRGLPIPDHPAIALREHAHEWIAYLKSARFEALTGGASLDVLAKIFSPEHHRAAVHDYFQKILAERRLS
jgi:Glycosyl transferases group 1